MNIIKNRKIYIALSLIIMLVGIGFMFYNNSQGLGFFNLDIQFTGGTSIEVNVGKSFENEEFVTLYKEILDIDNTQIQKIGNGESVTIKTRSLTQEERIKITEAIVNQYEITEAEISLRDISATISQEMQQTAFLAIIVSCIAMLLYVSIRFRDFRIGASSIIALAHDALIVLSFYAIFRIPLNEAFIAAILTVLGYSINATIIIFDRLREDKTRNFSKPNEELINGAINKSFRRSIFTSLTTFLTVLGLYIFGVESVRIFALPIAIGIICGTYSSLFIAGSIWYIISNKSGKKIKN